MDPDPLLLLNNIPNNNLIAFEYVFNILLVGLLIFCMLGLFILNMFEKALIKLDAEELKLLEKENANRFELLRTIFTQSANVSTTFAISKLFLAIIAIVNLGFLIPFSHQYALLFAMAIVLFIGLLNWFIPVLMPQHPVKWVLRGLQYTSLLLQGVIPWANKIAPAEPRLPEDDVSLEELQTALPEKDNKVPSIANLNLYKQVLRFDKILIKNVMRPRKEIAGIKANYNFKEVLAKIELSNFSRLPVYEENWQHILGIIHCKDLLPFTHLDKYDWKKHLRPIVYVQENDLARSVLRIFQNSKSHMALVQNEAKELVGIVTLEDITEEIIGEIEDE